MEKNEKNPNRREALVAALGAFAASRSGLATAARSSNPVRRLVTGDDDAGHSALLFRDADVQSVELNGSTITRLWETDAVPTTLTVESDRGAAAGNAYRDGFQGTSLYVADIPPGNVDAIPMHRQDSLDYIAILEGEIELVLETETVRMTTGDILVQAGNMHTWNNHGDTNCRLLVVVLRASRD